MVDLRGSFRSACCCVLPPLVLLLGAAGPHGVRISLRGRRRKYPGAGHAGGGRAVAPVPSACVGTCAARAAIAEALDRQVTVQAARCHDRRGAVSSGNRCSSSTAAAWMWAWMRSNTHRLALGCWSSHSTSHRSSSVAPPEPWPRTSARDRLTTEASPKYVTNAAPDSTGPWNSAKGFATGGCKPEHAAILGRALPRARRCGRRHLSPTIGKRLLLDAHARRARKYLLWRRAPRHAIFR